MLVAPLKGNIRVKDGESKNEKNMRETKGGAGGRKKIYKKLNVFFGTHLNIEENLIFKFGKYK